MKNTGNKMKNLTLAGLTALAAGCTVVHNHPEETRIVRSEVPVYEVPTGELSPAYLRRARLALADGKIEAKELRALRTLLGGAQKPNRAREARILHVLEQLSIDRDATTDGLQGKIEFPVAEGGRVYEFHTEGNGYVTGARGTSTSALSVPLGERKLTVPAGYTMNVGTPGMLTARAGFSPLSDAERNREHCQVIVTLPENAQGERARMTWYSSEMPIRRNDVGYRLLTGAESLPGEVIRPLDLVTGSQIGVLTQDTRSLLQSMLTADKFVGRNDESDLLDAQYHLATNTGTPGVLEFDELGANAVEFHYGVPQEQLENAAVGTRYGLIRVQRASGADAAIMTWSIIARTNSGVTRLNTTWNLDDRRAQDIVKYVTERATQLNHDVPVLGRHDE